MTLELHWASLPEYIYFLSFPLITGLILLLFPWFALVKTRSVSANLLDLTGFGIACVTLASCALAWTVMLTAWTILNHGQARFGATPFLPTSAHIPVSMVVGFIILAVPLIFFAARYSVTQGTSTVGEAIRGVASGLLAAAVIASAILNGVPKLLQPVQHFVNPLSRYLGNGYSGDDGLLYRDHAVAIMAFGAAFLIYVVAGILKWQHLLPGVPSLTYLLLFLVLVCWTLSSLGFFLDYYRIPVALVIGIWLTATSLLSNTDHFFHVWKDKDSGFPEAPRPHEVLSATQSDSVIAVAANGGGIQSAAWTAKVLAGLESLARSEFPENPGIFSQSVRIISSVSGGSVGSMYFVNAFNEQARGIPFGPAALNEITTNAKASSLDKLTWGLFYPDFLKTIIPFPGMHTRDRGHALEVAFSMQDHSLTQPLASWRQGVREGWRPATTFNATISDTGERLLLSTADLDPRSGDARKNFSELFPKEPDRKDLQLSIASAARLSASFPYVSPAARADLGGPGEGQWHVVDGGYYDNYGMSTLVEWLGEGLSEPRHGIERVLIVQIRGLPPDDAGKPGTQRGWFYQLIAPVSTMLNVRSCGQLSHNNVEFDLLTEYWANRGVGIESVVFQFPSRQELGEDPPLSWHLTPKQQDAIDKAWERPEIQSSCQQVASYLRKSKRRLPQAAAATN